MHARLTRLVTMAAIVAATVVGPQVAAPPAGAGDGPACGITCPQGTPPVQQQGEDIVGDIRAQVNTLNSGSPGSGGPPPSCTWRDHSGPEPVERTDGTPRWRPPGIGHEGWADTWEGGVGTGTIYRYECWHPDMGCRSPAPVTEGCLGEAIDATWCGAFLCLFDAVNPPNLALLAVTDGFLERLGPPTPQFSPEGETLVNFDTWLWLADIPADGEQGPWSMAVPGQEITATAAVVDEVLWDMGDGQDPVPCPITTDEASAQASCHYSYDRASVGQPNNQYVVTVSVNWVVTWEGTVLGTPVSGTIPAPRTGETTLAVSEAQSLNTDGGG